MSIRDTILNADMLGVLPVGATVWVTRWDGLRWMAGKHHDGPNGWRLRGEHHSAATQATMAPRLTAPVRQGTYAVWLDRQRARAATFRARRERAAGASS